MSKISREQIYLVAGPREAETEFEPATYKTAEDMAQGVANIFADLSKDRVLEAPLPIPFTFSIRTKKDIGDEGVVQRLAHSMLRSQMDMDPDIEDLTPRVPENLELLDDMPPVFQLGSWLVRQTVHTYAIEDDVRSRLEDIEKIKYPPNGEPYLVVYQVEPAT